MRQLCYTLLFSSLLLAGCNDDNDDEQPTPRADQTAHLIAFNDFHGNLEPPLRRITAPDPGNPGKTVDVPAGGAAYMATAIAQLKQKYPLNAVVSAGDMVSASPLVSSLFLDEPTIHVMNQIKVDFNAVGNHEFDRGTNELRRLQNGGCQQFTSIAPCQIDKDFKGASFKFLAANVEQKADKKTIFPEYGIKQFGDIPVAFIGLTLKNTPSIVAAAGITDVTFKDEAESINRLIPELKKQGVKAIVVLIHEGLAPSTSFNTKTCDGLSGPLFGILDQLDPEIDVVVSGHTHQSYICDYAAKNPAKPFLVTSSGQYGTMLTDITLQLDGKTGDVKAKDAKQVIVQSEPYTSNGTTYNLTNLYDQFIKDTAVDSIIQKYKAAVAPVANRTIGSIKQDILRAPDESGESPLGNLIANAQLEASKGNGAQLAFMNSGGVRADLLYGTNGQVTYGAAYSVQPFGNSLVTLSMTGSQIKQVLEQQWSENNANSPRILLPSQGFSYSYRKTGTLPRASNITLNGQPLIDNQNYRVSVSNFLADGGDGFTGFKQGNNPVGGGQDITALESYLSKHSPIGVVATDRIHVAP